MAAAQLSSARAALAVMQHNIELGELFSPTEAVVSSRLLEPGDMASSATPVFLLSLTSPKWVRAYVTEPQLGRIRQGMKADILTDSFPEAVPVGWATFRPRRNSRLKACRPKTCAPRCSTKCASWPTMPATVFVSACP